MLNTSSSQPVFHTTLSQLPQLSDMAPNSERHKDRDGTLTALNVAIDGLNLAKEISSVTPAKAVFGSVSVILTMVRVRFLLSPTAMSFLLTTIQESMMNERDYVELVLICADICLALDRGTDGKELDDLSQSVREAINQLMT
jgi:hypothetical protein